jgi:hypothetical protein
MSWLPNMSIINCSVPSSARVGDSGPAHSASKNNATKSLKLRELGSNFPDEVVNCVNCVNSSEVDASNKVSELGRSPHISATVIYKRSEY